MKRRSGFTLIELMVVIVVVAILAMVAYPAYENANKKGRRASAQAFMMEVAQREQAYILDNRAYAVGAGALAALGMTAPAEVSRFYTVAVTEVAGGPPDFIITATPLSGGAQVPDGVLMLNSAGAKTRAGDPAKW